MGGWGLDFLVGRVTRPHDDVDFFVWGTDAEKIYDLLTTNGYTNKPARHPEESAYFSKQQQRVDFTFLERDELNRIIVSGRFRGWPLPETSFSQPPVFFNGIGCPVLDADGQFCIKAEFHKQPAGGPPRSKDRNDLPLLRQLLDLK